MLFLLHTRNVGDWVCTSICWGPEMMSRYEDYLRRMAYMDRSVSTLLVSFHPNFQTCFVHWIRWFWGSKWCVIMFTHFLCEQVCNKGRHFLDLLEVTLYFVPWQSSNFNHHLGGNIFGTFSKHLLKQIQVICFKWVGSTGPPNVGWNLLFTPAVQGGPPKNDREVMGPLF